MLKNQVLTPGDREMQGTLEQGKSLAQQHQGTGKPEIIIAGQAGVSLTRVAGLLENAGLKRPTASGTVSELRGARTILHESADLEDGIRELQNQPGAHLLLLYRDPATQIAEAVAADVDPVDAVVLWQQQADELLAAYRRARRRITLLELSAALAEPNDMVRALNQHLGLSLATLADIGQAEQEPERDPVHILIADRALHQDTSARHTAAELEASALPVAGTPGPAAVDLSSTCKTYREKSEMPAGQINSLKEENELLLDQLQQAREELKSQRTRHDELTSKVLELEERNKELAAENEGLRAEAESEKQAGSAQEELKEENELLLMQLHQVQEELESYFLENQDINNKLKTAQKENQELERQARQARNMLNDAHASLSWKITAPIRLLLRPFMGK